MKLLYSIAFLCSICLPSLAQQRPQHTQYFQNNYLLNPAVTGIESFADIRSGYRSQWVGMEGAPVTFYTSAQTSIGKNDRNVTPARGNRDFFRSNITSANKNNRFHVKPHHGVGAVAQMDIAGLLTTASLNVSYAYHLPLTQNLNLSGGLTTGIVQYRLNSNNLRLLTPEEPYINTDFGNRNKLDLGVGLWLYNRDFYVGISGTQLVKSGNDVDLNNGLRVSMKPHYYATGGYRILVSEMLTFTPSVLVKMAAGGLAKADLNAKALYGQRFWAGISYRHNDAIAAIAGLYLSHMIDISYSYDFTTSQMNRVSANSHEVVVGIKLNNPQKVVCPSWVW